MPLPLGAFLAASSWAAKTVLLSGETLNLILTAVQVLRAPSLWEGVETILDETEYGELTDLLDAVIDELLTEADMSLPTGTVIMWAGEWDGSIPDGFLLCDGTAVSRSEYAELFALFGTLFGTGDGSTTFNLPDFRFRVPMGTNPAGNNIGGFSTIELSGVGGAENVALTESEIPAHTHTYTRYSALIGGIQLGSPSVGNIHQATSNQNTGSKGGGQAHTNLQPFLSLNFLIKT